MRIEIYLAHKTADKAEQAWAVRTPEKIIYCRSVLVHTYPVKTSFDPKREPVAVIVVEGDLIVRDGEVSIFG
jgi:hypothetical protein